jgi:hypothetical protein
MPAAAHLGLGGLRQAFSRLAWFNPAGVQSYSESPQLPPGVVISAGVQLLTGANQGLQIHSQRMTTAVLYLVPIDDRERCCNGDPWPGHAGGDELAACRVLRPLPGWLRASGHVARQLGSGPGAYAGDSGTAGAGACAAEIFARQRVA